MKYRTPGTMELAKEVIALHKQGLRQFQIAEKVGIDRQAVRYHLIKAGAIPPTPPPNVPNAKGYKSEYNPNYQLVKKYMDMNYGSRRIALVTGLTDSNVRFWMAKIRKGSIRTPLYIKDHQDRRTLEGFRKYMKENPYYFEFLYGNMSIDDAYKEAMGIRREHKRSTLSHILDGLPEGDGDMTVFSIGYGDR